MKRFLTIGAIVLLLSGSTSAYDFLTGRGTAFGQAILLSEQSPSELLNLPTGSLQLGEFRVETALNRAFDLKDFDQFMLAAAGRKGKFSLAIGFSQFGRSELYTEQTAKGTLALHIDSLTIAVGGSYRILGFGGTYADLSAATFHASAAYRYRSFSAAIGADNLTSPSLNDGSPAIQPVYVSEIEYRGGKNLALVGRVQLQEMERPRFSLGQYIGLGNSAALMLGVITAPTQPGGGIEFNFKRGRISYGASVHPVLGLSQTLSISFGNRQRKAKTGGEFE
ncbi:MAG: hypothetical protein IPH75_00790 [bacterium]|nr:hypothetical protein [bacterium]